MRLNISTGVLDGSNVTTENNKVTAEIKNALLTKGLSEGQVFRGNIQDIIGSNVKINLGDGNILQAILDNGVDFNIGEDVNFIVKSNDGSKVVLQTVSEGGQTEISRPLMNFLGGSGLDINEKNIRMVKEMMAYNMPLDRESLVKMEKLIKAYPKADVMDIVSMKSHNIPINEENIGQFQAYKSYEHKITENISRFTQELIKIAEGNNSDGFIPEILKALGDESVLQTTEKIYNQDEIVQKPNEASGVGEALMKPEADGENKQNVHNTERTVITITEDGIKLRAHETEAPDEQIYPETENKEGFEALDKNMHKDSHADILKKAISDLKSKWSTDIGEFEQKSGDEIKSLIRENYESMSKGIGKIMDTLKNHGMENTNLYKAAENIKSNMQFMSDLNNMISYVQIPFNTQQGEKSGELYVYNRNKNKSISDGAVTAFLHLDMEHLGATDVKVAMEKGRVKTSFILEDKVSQDIVEKHLPLLKERLEKQGYYVELTSEFEKKEESTTPFEKILEMDKPRKDIKRYGFDIRL